MISANCPCCNKLILPEEANSARTGSGFGHIFCPHCNKEITWGRRSQLWLLPSILAIPTFVVCAAIDGNSAVDSVIEYIAVAGLFIGFIGAAGSFHYEEVAGSDRSSEP